MKVKIVFFGTPFFAAEILRYLLENHVPIVAIVTQPDRPKGRSLQLSPSPVKLVTQEFAPTIPIFQPEKASQEPFLKDLAALKADLFVVAAFGQILPQKLLDIPPLGSINVHPSLLPKYRGATPIQSSLLDGAKGTGVSIQKMVLKMDAGDVISTVKMDIPASMTFGELEKKLCDLSKPLLLSIIHSYEKGIPPGTPQDPNLATYCTKIELEQGEIDWNRPAQELHNLIRAFSPRPGAWCWVHSNHDKKRLKILRSETLTKDGNPGEWISLPDAIVACGQGALKLLEVQLEGKKAMSGPDWLRGQKSPPHLVI